MPEISVTFDETNQVFRQEFHVPANAEILKKGVELVDQMRMQLRNPQSIGILAKDENFGRPDREMRKYASEIVAKPELKGVAIYEAGPLTRTLAKFISIAAGNGKIRAFKTELQALDWLKKKCCNA